MKVLPKKLGILFVLFVLTTVVFPYTACAATKPKPIPAEFYSAIRKNLFMDEVLQSTDPATLSVEQVEEAVTGAIAAGTVPQVGVAIGENGVYTLTTGMTGAAVGMIPVGTYSVAIDSIDGVTASPPKTIVVSRSRTNTVEIPMRYVSLTDQMKDRIPRFSFWQKKGTGAPLTATALVVVQLFRDTNTNGIRDKKEVDVPWANAVITLTKISKEYSIQLVQGSNTVTFDRMPRNFQTVLGLVTDIISNGTSDITISSMVDGAPYMITVRNGVTYGVDAQLQIKQPYIITVDTASGIAIVE